MTASAKSEKYILLDNLFNLFLDSYSINDEDELFNEWEIDIETIVDKNLALFRQLRTHAKAELNRIKYKRVQEFLTKLKEGLTSNKIGYQEFANDLITNPTFSELAPLFKNLTKLSENDKESLLLDAKILDVLDSFDDEFRKKALE